MKKLATLLGTGAVFLTLAVPAFGYDCHGFMCWRKMLGDKNFAKVKNVAVAESDTGRNFQIGSGDMKMYTGNAGADAYAEAVVNSSDCCESCWCPGDFNKAKVKNFAKAESDTGGNMQIGMDKEDHNPCHNDTRRPKPKKDDGMLYMKTGAAYSSAGAWSVVNSNWSE